MNSFQPFGFQTSSFLYPSLQTTNSLPPFGLQTSIFLYPLLHTLQATDSLPPFDFQTSSFFTAHCTHCRPLTPVFCLADLLPFTVTAGPETREFLAQVAELSIDFVKQTFDRNSKILDFHQPEQLKEVLDLEIPAQSLNLDQLLVDCKDALKYQVKTGECYVWFLLLFLFSLVIFCHFFIIRISDVGFRSQKVEGYYLSNIFINKDTTY